jgi:hypothetical protein
MCLLGWAVPRTFEAVADSTDIAYVMSADWKLERTNAGWTRFALENGGAGLLERWPQGSSIKDAIPSVLWAFYGEAFERVSATGQHWEHDFECSSPEAYRLMHMIVYPSASGSLLVVNTPTIERAHVMDAVSANRAEYERQGLMVTCSHCRRFRNASREGRWDWVPELVSNPPARLSHGLCPPCLEHYYPE